MVEDTEIKGSEKKKSDISKEWVQEEIAKELLVESLANDILQEERTQHIRERTNQAVNHLLRELAETQRWLRTVLLTQRAILETLGKANLCDPGVIDLRAKELVDLLVNPQFARGLGTWLDRRNPVEFDEKEEVIDCSERFDICKAACCRFRLSLDVTSITSKCIKYNREYPFTMIRREDGYCMYLKEGKCTVYDSRPLVCRTYSCRNDKRIWEDFDNKVPSENLKKWQKKPQ